MKKLRELWTALFRRYLASWHTRWAAKPRKDRAILAGKLIGLLVTLWLAFWYVSGPSSVDVGDIQVDLDRSLSLAGPDQDRNGIRDDVDRYIDALVKAKGYSEPQVKALKQNARALQSLLTVNLDNERLLYAAADSSNRAAYCLFLKFDEDEASSLGIKIEKITVNTKRRAIAYTKLNHAMSGTVSASPQGSACEP